MEEDQEAPAAGEAAGSSPLLLLAAMKQRKNRGTSGVTTDEPQAAEEDNTAVVLKIEAATGQTHCPLYQKGANSGCLTHTCQHSRSPGSQRHVRNQGTGTETQFDRDARHVLQPLELLA